MKKQKLFMPAMALLISFAMALATTPFAFASEYDASGATSFNFSDSGIAVTEGSYTGYSVDGTALTINGAGTYLVSGSCSDGSITVKKGTTGVTLVLNGLTLTSSDTAPIACNKSSEVTIVAASGTTNTLTDSAYNNDDIYTDNTNAENAVIKCKDGSQVTICGGGTLNINANGKNGIKSGATTETEGEAWLLIQGSVLNISATVNDAINAEQLLTITGGTITISAAEDAIHSDYVLNIGSEGTAGPKINITNCYEGLEAATLNVYSGDITIHSVDDCMNAANADLTNYAFSINIAGGTLYMDTTSGDGIDSNGTLTISGGTTEVWTASTADNQPLDADGSISITGGTVIGAGGSSGMGTNLSASQGYVVFGSSGMGGGMGGMRPGQPGQSGSSVNIASGSEITVKDSSGNTVYSGTAPCNLRYVIFSSTDLTSGNTYTLYSGTSSVASATAQGESGSSGGGPSTPGGRPEDTDTSSEDTDITSEDTDTTSEDTDTTSEDTDTTSEDTDTTSEDTDTTSEDTDTSSEDTDTSSEDTDTASEDTDTSSEDTDTASEDTDTSSEDTDTPNDVKLGDLDENGVIDIADVVLMRAGIVGNIKFTENQRKAADVTCEGDINITDVVVVRNMIVNG
ncbi:MAG: carbohydrate-binding domain-containing protein [Oscillospiraceae bacterium]